MKLLQNFRKTLRADRILPPGQGWTSDDFEGLYAKYSDPWGVQSSPFAQQRYLKLLEVIGQHGPCDAILDVGCGEGALARHLVGCAREVVGIDASQTAITRARQLTPKATFHCSTLEEFSPRRRFDVVLAVEVLYYVPSVEAALRQLIALGRRIVVSYTNRERQRLEPYLDRYRAESQRQVFPFFESKKFGFTVVELLGLPAENPG